MSSLQHAAEQDPPPVFSGHSRLEAELGDPLVFAGTREEATHQAPHLLRLGRQHELLEQVAGAHC